MTEVDLHTTGLHCNSCSMLVDMTVGDLDGVSTVSTDFQSGSTHVEYDAEVVNVDDIIKAIQEAGYDAERA